MSTSLNVCVVCERAFKHKEAEICLECCTISDLDALHRNALRCRECNHNFATVKVDGELYCDEHSPAGYTAIDYSLSLLEKKDARESGELDFRRPHFSVFYRTVMHLLDSYQDYDAAFSRLREWIRKGYHLNSLRKVESTFCFLWYFRFPLLIKVLMGDNEFETAHRLLDFITEKPMEELGLSQQHSVTIAIWKSNCLQHAQKFPEARSLLGHILWHVTDVGYFAKEETQELEEDDYREAIEKISDEIYACGRRAIANDFRDRMKFAGKFIEDAIPEEDFTILNRINRPIELDLPEYAPRSFDIDINSTESPKAILARDEDEKLEYKSTLSKNLITGQKDEKIEKSCLKTIVAFLNSNGGTLYIGVEDSGKPIGIRQDVFPTEDKMSRYLSNLIQEHIGLEHQPNIDYKFITHGEERLLVVESCRSDCAVHLTYNRKEEFFIRVGSTTRSLAMSKADEYKRKRFQQ